jgi:DNA-binding Lrp family transcriptional regulator
MVIKLDKTDLKIVGSLTTDPRMTVTQIATNSGLSRPTVISRLKRLNSEEIIDIEAGLKMKNLDLLIAGLSLEIKGQKDGIEMENRLSSCPRILLFSKLLNKANFWILLFGENPKTMRCAIECIRDLLSGEIMDVSYSDSSMVQGNLLVKVFPEKYEVTPCGKTCSDCLNYIDENCIGCPKAIEYKGIL